MRISRPTSSPSLGLAGLSLLLLSLSSTAFAATQQPDRAECLRSRAAQLADVAACGHKGSIEYCLSHQIPIHAHLCSAKAIEPCFVNAGCTPAEAEIEAQWTLKRCDEKGQDGDDMGDLRKRQRGGAQTDDQNGGQQTQPAGNGGGRTQNAPQRTTNAPQRQPTTQAAPQNTPDQPTQQPTPTPEVEIVTVSASDSTGLSTFSPTTTALVCFTTTTVSTTTCPIQSTGPQSGKETLPCFPTLVSYPTCAAGLLCKSDAQGNPVCMKVDNTFSTAGIIISLFFAVAVTAAVAAMCFFCCRERRVQSRLRKAAEAAAIAKAAALDKKRPSVGVRSVSAQSRQSDSQPLMYGNQGGGYQDSQQTVVYQEGNMGENPFADQHRMR